MTNYDNRMRKIVSGFDKRRKQDDTNNKNHSKTKIMITIHYNNSEKRINVHKTVQRIKTHASTNSAHDITLGLAYNHRLSD